MKYLLLSALVMVTTVSAQARFEGIKKAGDDMSISYLKIQSEPIQTAAATLLSPSGNIIKFSAQAADSASSTVVHTLSQVVDSGLCLKQLPNPMSTTGCAVQSAGSIILLVWDGVGYQAHNIVEFAGTSAGALLKAWSGMFKSCSAHMGKVAGLPCEAVAFTLDAAGRLVKFSATAVNTAIDAVTQGTTGIVKGAIDIPVGLLQGDVKKSAKGVGKIVAYGLGTFAKILFLPLIVTKVVTDPMDDIKKDMEKL